MKGSVKYFSDFKGYGFIVGEDGQDYFVHVSQIRKDGLKTLDSNDEVEFMPSRSNKGLQALDVETLNNVEAGSHLNDFIFKPKKNPFTPQDPVTDTEKFSGRLNAISNCIDNLYNGKNILITGPRGIGKSSLSYQLLFTTQGEIELLKKIGVNEKDLFNNVISDFRCMPNSTLTDITSGLITNLMTNLDIYTRKDTTTTKKNIDLKFFGFGEETVEKNFSSSDLSVLFVAEVENILKQYAFESFGVTFLIDEVDVLDKNIDIASFLKATVEKFRLNYRKSVSVIVAGVSGTITNLLSQHQSVNRLFENIELQRMQHRELEEIILASLNGTDVEIEPEAITSIIKLSNGFPQPIHLLGYHAFRIDSDNLITIEDVEKSKRYIVQTLKKQEFESKFMNLGSGLNLEIIKKMASYKNEAVDTLELVRSLEMDLEFDRSKIYSALALLVQKGILERLHRDTYKFTDPLFKLHLQWVFGID